MAQTTFSPMGQWGVLNVRRCGRFLAYFPFKSATVTKHRLVGIPLIRRAQRHPVRALRRELSDSYVRCHTPSRLLGWR
jgi:hypothetical protein